MAELKKSLAWRMSVCVLGALLLAAWLPEARAQIDRQKDMEHANGVKRVLIVRIEPEGKPGNPIPEAEIRDVFKEVNDILVENSGGKLSFEVTVAPVVFLAGPDLNSLIVKATKAANLDFAKFDVTLWIKDDGKGSGVWGKGIEWPNFLVHGPSLYQVIFSVAQALDIAFANGWQSSNENPLGAGIWVRNRNRFDLATIGEGHFNTAAKNYLGWLSDGDVQTITKSGAYRVAAHDQPNSTGTRALRINRDGERYYWIEFRQRFTENPWAMNGALVMWDYHSGPGAILVDMTPGSIGQAEFDTLGFWGYSRDLVDAPLVIGQTFSDRKAGVYITPLRKVTVNGLDGKPLKALDIMVNLGQFPDNHPPTLSIKASAQTAKPEQPVTFKATADDADGDKITYFWDFGDFGFNGGNATTSHAWEEEREYVVRCTATDAKGGTASSSLVVKVGAPQTTRIAGRILVDGKPLSDAVVRVVPEKPPASATQDEEVVAPPINRVFTDSDGRYTLVNLPAKRVQIEAGKEGYKIAPAGMSTHVGPIAFVASKTAQLDFDAVPVPIAIPPGTAPFDAETSVAPQTATAVPALAVPAAPVPAIPAKTPARAMPVLPAIPAVAVPGEEAVLVASVDRPRSGGKGLPPLSGLAASLPEGRVKGVEVSIQRLSDNFYWNGKFWSAEKKGLPAVIAGKKWTLARRLPALGDVSEGETYTIAATALGTNGERSLTPDTIGEPPLLLDGKTSGLLAPRVAGLATGNAPHTVEMWMRPTALPGPGALVGLMSLGNGDNNDYWSMQSWQGDIVKASLEIIGVPHVDVPLDTWMHLASSFDGKGMTMCVNGKPVARLEGRMVGFQKPRLLAGLMTDDPAIKLARLEGGIGQVRVWNRARTPQEIERDMHERMTGTEDGLILLWRMEEGRGNVLHDSSGHGNDGQIIGGSTWARVSSVQFTLDPAKP